MRFATSASRSSPRRGGFQAVFFDLFSTLVFFDDARLPEVEFEGRRFRSTAPAVFQGLQERGVKTPSYPEFLEKFLEQQEEVSRRRLRDLKEYSSLSRFQVLAERLGLKASEAAPILVARHMEQMSRAMYLPPETPKVLSALSRRRLFLASNFDDAATARRALRRFGIARFFEEVFISEEIGWRKPAQKFFGRIIEESGVEPGSCLFVGDDPRCDVGGAGQAGFLTAWLCPSGSPSDPSVRADWSISRLIGVPDIVAGTVPRRSRGSPIRKGRKDDGG